MFKKLFDKLMGVKTFDLDNDGKIESLRDEVIGVFDQFKAMANKIDEVSGKLQEIVSDEEKVKEVAEKRIEKALTELEMNEKLKDRLKDFIL